MARMARRKAARRRVAGGRLAGGAGGRAVVWYSVAEWRCGIGGSRNPRAAESRGGPGRARHAVAAQRGGAGRRERCSSGLESCERRREDGRRSGRSGRSGRGCSGSGRGAGGGEEVAGEVTRSEGWTAKVSVQVSVWRVDAREARGGAPCRKHYTSRKGEWNSGTERGACAK